MAYRSDTSDSILLREPLWVVLVSAVVAAVLLLLFSGSTSPCYQLAYADGLVFQYVAMGIAEGKMPYVDVFDNKGPLLYFLNYIGRQFNPDYGLLCMQWVHLSFFLFFCHRLHLRCGGRYYFSWILPLIITFLVRFLGDGNLTEEWSLTLLLLPLFYIFPLYCGEQDHLSPLQSFLYGLCVGLVALLRFNNVVPLIGILLVWLVSLLLKRQYVALLRFAAYAVVGFLLPLIVTAAWFYHHAGLYGLYEWVYATLLVNVSYFGEQLIQPSSIPLWKLLPVVFFHALFIGFCLLRYCKGSHPQWVNALLLTFFLTYLTMGQSWYAHYQLILLPTFLLSVSLITQLQRPHYLLAILVLTSLYMCKYTFGNPVRYYEQNGINRAFQRDFAQVMAQIPVTERSKLWNLNVSIYQFVDVAYDQHLFPVNRIDRPQLAADRFPPSSFTDQQPLWVLVDADATDLRSNEAQCLLQCYHPVAHTHSQQRHNLSLYKHN